MTDIHEAEDIAAAAFFELWRKRRTARVVDGSVLPWLLVTTVNLSRNAHRSNTRYQRLLNTIPRETVATTANLDSELIEVSDRLTQALRRLSPTDSALFVLVALEDLPLANAAETVGLSLSTARMRLHRARVRLRGDLQDLNPKAQQALEGNS